MQIEIAEILNNMREDNERNIEHFEKLLAGVNSKLEIMAEDNEAVEMVRFYISELKKVVEEKYSAALIKFDDIENTFGNILALQDQVAKTSELKDLFGVFSAHADAFMLELSEQKDMLSALSATLSRVDEKAFDKNELIDLIEKLSLELSQVAENIQKSFAQTLENLQMLDMSENFADIKKAVDLLSEHIEAVPSKISFTDLEEKFKNDFENIADKMESVKEALQDGARVNYGNLSSEITMLIEKFEESFSNLDSTRQDEFSDLKSDMSVILENVKRLADVSYQSSFDQLSGLTAQIAENISILRSSIGADVQEHYSAVKFNLETLITNLQIVKEDLIENCGLVYKDSFTDIEGKINSIISLLEYLKTQDNTVDFSEIITLLDKSYQDISSFLDDMKSNSDTNYEALKDYIEELSSNVNTMRSDFRENSLEVSEKIISELTGTIQNDIKVLENAVISGNEDFIQAVKENTSEIKDYILEINNSLTVDKTESQNKLYSKLETLETLNNSFEISMSEVIEILQDTAEKISALNVPDDALKNRLDELANVLDLVLSSVNTLNIQNNEIVQKIFDNLSILTTDSVINREKLIEISENLSKIEPIDYSCDIQQIYSKVDDILLENSSNYSNIAEKLENLKEMIETFDNSQAVKEQFEGFERAFSKVVTEEDFLNFKTEFAEFISKIIDNSTALYTNSNELKASNTESFEKINNSLSELSSNIQYLKDLSSEKPSEIIDNINRLISDTVTRLNSDNEVNFAELKNLFENLVFEIDEFKQDFAQKNDVNVLNISSSFDNLKKSTDNLLSILNSFGETNESIYALDEKLSKLNDILAVQTSEMNIKHDEYIHCINEGNDKTSVQFSSLNQNIDGLKQYVGETAESLKSYMDELEIAANSVKLSSDEKLTQKLLDLETAFVHGSEEYEQKLELLKSKITEFAHIVENSNSDTEGKIASSLEEICSIKDELLSVSDTLKAANISTNEKFAETVSLIDAGVENIIFGVNTLSDTIVSGVDASVKENISSVDKNFADLFNIINELKNVPDNVDLIQNIETKISSLKDELGLVNSDITDALQCKTEEIIRAFDPIKTGIDEFVGFDFGKILADLREQIEVSFMNFTADINNEFAAGSENVARLEQAYKEIFAKLSVIEDYVSDKINNNIELLNVALETGLRDFKFSLEGKIEEESSELKAYVDTACNSLRVENSVNELKHDVLENASKLQQGNEALKLIVDEISSKLDVIVSDSSLEELQDRFDELLEGDANVSALISASFKDIHGRFDNILQKSENVSGLIEALHAKVDTIAAGNSDFDILEEIDGIKDIIFEQRKFFEASSDEKSAAIDKYLRDVLLKLDNVDMDKNSEDIKESILNALVSLVDQISFVEETEEIKDFVEEKTDEINQNLIEVQNQLKQLTNPGDDFDYSYSLQDVESDIAKLRLAINNMSGNDFSDITDEMQRIVEAVEGLENSLTQDQIVDLKNDIEKLNEDIVSISSRTNKLLLNSDEAYKTLNDGLNNFSNVIYKLEDRINYLDNTEIERKLDNIHSLAVETDNANKVSRQVMMYLGEWIDTAGENINVIAEKTSDIDIIKENIQELKDIIPEKSDILNAIEDKFEKQEERIDRLEMKLERILSKFDEKDDMLLSNKVDNIEQMLSKLAGNIEKLASYVDEE